MSHRRNFRLLLTSRNSLLDCIGVAIGRVQAQYLMRSMSGKN